MVRTCDGIMSSPGRLLIVFAVFCGLANCQNGIPDRITFDFSSYNTTNKTTHIQKQFAVIDQVGITIDIKNVSNKLGFLVVQAHSYANEISLEQKNSFVRGSNLGLVQLIAKDDNGVYNFTVKSQLKENSTAMLIVMAYDETAPIPGGCSMTFPTEIAPYEVLNYTEDLIRVDLQPPMIQGHLCEDTLGELNVYHMYLEVANFSPGAFFEGIDKLLTVENVLKNGFKVRVPYTFSTWRRYFSAYIGTGSVFVAVATYGNSSSAYVPAISYACSLEDDTNNCMTPISSLWAWTLAFLLFIGHALIFFGHRLFSFTIFIAAFIVGNFVLYSFLSFISMPLSADAIGFSVYLVAGIGFGLIWITIWKICAKPVVSVLLSLVLTGFLVSACIFYFGLGDVHVYENDINFWGTVTCVTLTITLILTIATNNGHIWAVSFLGAYMAVLPMGFYFGANLHYIVINMARRVTVENFNKAIVDPPYQLMDVIFTIYWAVFTTIGYIFQKRRNHGRAPFPPPHNLIFATERTPLISPSSIVYA